MGETMMKVVAAEATRKASLEVKANLKVNLKVKLNLKQKTSVNLKLNLSQKTSVNLKLNLKTNRNLKTNVNIVMNKLYFKAYTSSYNLFNLFETFCKFFLLQCCLALTLMYNFILFGISTNKLIFPNFKKKKK